ncbi:MAG: Fe3+-citrate ABC transporter substrate-binding protein, partial [Treponema sp.]|nr:Fe3+-citrate ABC transporter substrate-binding protein [Treponema sp.]
MKKSFLAVLGLTMIFNFTGCTKKQADNAKPATRTIIDHTGREVVIPAELNRIVIGSILPLASVYCMYMGSTEKLVGMHPSSMAAAKNSYLATVYPEVTKIDS